MLFERQHPCIFFRTVISFHRTPRYYRCQSLDARLHCTVIRDEWCVHQLSGLLQTINRRSAIKTVRLRELISFRRCLIRGHRRQSRCWKWEPTAWLWTPLLAPSAWLVFRSGRELNADRMTDYLLQSVSFSKNLISGRKIWSYVSGICVKCCSLNVTRGESEIWSVCTPRCEHRMSQAWGNQQTSSKFR